MTATRPGRPPIDPDGSSAAAVQAAIDAEAAARAVADALDVQESLYDANSVLAATTDNTPAAITMGASTILARLAAGNIKAASVAEIKTLLAIAEADVSGLTDALAAKMSNTVADANSVLYAVTDDTPAALAVAASRVVGRKASGDVSAMTGAETLAILFPAAPVALEESGVTAAQIYTALATLGLVVDVP